MNIIKSPLLILAFWCIYYTNNAFAQIPSKQDIYYFLDTASVPVNDRLISFEYDRTPTKILGTGYNIDIPCIKANSSRFKPSFLRIMRIEGTWLTATEFKKIQLTTLAKLIEIACNETNTVDFNKKYNVYFIEPHKEGYLQHLVKVFYPRVTDDVIYLPLVDSTKKD